MNEILDTTIRLLENCLNSTFALLVEYLLEPTKDKITKIKCVLAQNLEISAKIRDIIFEMFHDKRDTSIVVLARTFIGLVYDMLQDLESDPELLFDGKFREKYIKSLGKLVEMCGEMHKLYGEPFRFYRSLLLCLLYILKNYKS